MICTVRPMAQEAYQQFRFKDEDASFGTLSTPQGHLPLRQLKLVGTTVGLAYKLRLTQTFLNVHPGSLEATYIFPLPSRAAVTRFVMRTPEREVVGELQEREQARENYERAIADGFQAAIAEEERPEVFTMRVGNIPGRSQVEIELELSGPLTVADGTATFRFPLVVAPRYIPGRALGDDNIGDGVAADTDATPDASRITPPVLLPGYPNPVQLSVDLDLDLAALGLREIECSLHELDLTMSADGRAHLRLSPKTAQLNRDLIVRFPIQADAIRGVLNESEEGGFHTWGLTLLPPTFANDQPRELVVLLDRSGSMQGWKMLAARRAVGRIVDSLNDGDRFSVVAFDDRLDTISPMQPGTDANRFRSVEKLGKVDARGGTEIAPAMAHALTQLEKSSAANRFLVLITDGQVGNEDQLLLEVQRRARGIRVFTIGIDQAVNAGLLTRLAEHTGGHCELVESEERLDQVMLALQRRLCAPVLTDVELMAGVDQVTPATVDLFPGLPARLYGRSPQSLGSSVMVRGRLSDGKLWEQMLEVVPTREPVVRQLWARERLLELEHGFTTHKAGLDYTPEAITRFSLAHGVMCRFTSFVAVDRSKRVSVGGPDHRVVQAVDTPAGWGANVGAALGGAAPMPAAPVMMRVPGAAAPAPPMQAAFGCAPFGGSDPFASGGGADPFASAMDPFAPAAPCSLPSPVCDAPPPAPMPSAFEPARDQLSSRAAAPRLESEKKKERAGKSAPDDAQSIVRELRQLLGQNGNTLRDSLERLVVALRQKGCPVELAQRGEDLMRSLDAKLLGVWLDDVQAFLDGKPTAKSGRGSWWKR